MSDRFPEHDRTSCTDDNLNNVGVNDAGNAYCRRCNELWEQKLQAKIEKLQRENDALRAERKDIEAAAVDGARNEILRTMDAHEDWSVGLACSWLHDHANQLRQQGGVDG